MNPLQQFIRRTRAGDFAISLFLLACLAMGGATREGYLFHAALQLTGFAILGWFWLKPPRQPFSDAARQVRAIGFLAMLLALLQLVPLPAPIWTSLPGREPIARGYELLGMQVPWHALTLTPDQTVFAIIAVIPAIAVVAATLRASRRAVDLALALVVAFGLVSMLLGLYEVMTGNYPYEITNRGQPSGFFSNSNHYATLMAVGLPICAALFARVRVRVGNPNIRVGAQVMLVSAALALLFGLIVSGSRAGYILGVVGIGASVPLVMLGREGTLAKGLVRLALLGALLLGVALIGAILLDFMGAAGSGSRLIERSTMLKTGWPAVGTYFPFGSGLGSFTTVYPQFEDADRVTTVFVNHAHNDFAELLIETGLAGVLIALLFFLWYARRTIALWSTPGTGRITGRLGTIGVLLIMLHSLVDYPARTIAVMSLLGFFIALMADPSLTSSKDVRRAADGTRKRRSKHRSM